MAKKEIKAYKSVFKLAQLTLGSYLRWFFRIRYENLEQVKGLQEPYVLLGNHTNFWDPVLVGTPLPSPVYFVASDEYFRKPILKGLLSLVGAIPKTKFMSDADTVKEIIRVKNKGGNIGIFPEGRRNWDGRTLEILYPTAKMVKSLKIPVVTALLQGATLSFPRWAKKPRRGRLIITYSVILSAEEVMTRSVEEIYQRMCQALAHDEYAFQQTKMIPYTGPALAESLELFLFACPHCQQMGTMHSEDDQFFCKACGYRTRYTEYGFFETTGEHLHFATSQDWNIWQLGLLEETLRKARTSSEPQPVLHETNVLLFRGTRLSPLQQEDTGEIVLYPDHLRFISSSGAETVFPIALLHGLNIQYNDRFEFYFDKTLYRFVFDGKIVSAYLWVQAMRMVQTDEEQKAKVSV